MSMIGIQSYAYQRQLNGLSSRVPYDVGRSMSTWSSTPIIEMPTSVANDASCIAAPRRGDDSRSMASLRRAS